MWMDAENKVSQEDVISPLSHDVNGAFSRQGDTPIDKVYDPLWLDTLLSVLFVVFLYFADIILFAGSGSLQVFNHFILPIPEVSILMFGTAILISLMITPFHTQRPVKYAIVAVLTFLFIYILFKQFAQYHKIFSVGQHQIPISIFVGFIVSAVTFSIFQQPKLLYRVLLVVAAGVFFGNVYVSYLSQQNRNHSFEKIYNTQTMSDTPNERFIYFMLPNFTSYTYLSADKNPEMQQLRDLIQGFYQKNQFKIYSQAYTPENTYLTNMVRSFNPFSDKSSKQHMMPTKMLDSHWRFYNLRNEYAYLQDNELYDYLQEHNYQISAYKSRDIEICRKRHEYNVNRCVEKVNRPTNLYNTNLPLSVRVGSFALEWIASMMPANVFQNVNHFLHNFKFFSPAKLGVSNLYVVNTSKIFDILANDIRKDTGKQAYIVFVDLPSNIYIYDEYCHIKQPQEWQSMTDMPWDKYKDNTERKKAYIQQTYCLLGQLAHFMDNLQKEGLKDSTTVLIQGTSGVGDFRKDTLHDTATNRFIFDRMVNMAIYQPQTQNNITKAINTNNRVDERFCSTNQLLAEYISGKSQCGEDLTGYHEKLRIALRQRIKELTLGFSADKTLEFNNWYDNWKKISNINQLGRDIKDKAELIGSRTKSSVTDDAIFTESNEEENFTNNIDTEVPVINANNASAQVIESEKIKRPNTDLNKAENNNKIVEQKVEHKAEMAAEVIKSQILDVSEPKTNNSTTQPMSKTEKSSQQNNSNDAQETSTADDDFGIDDL